jgi:hypothetical protein
MEAPELIDVSDIPDVLRLVQEVARSGVPVILARDGDELAILTPASKPKDAARPGGDDADEADSLLNIIGIGESAEPTDIAKHKHEYLAQAYESLNR